MSEYKIRPATVLDAINLVRLLRPVWEVNEEVSFPIFEKGAAEFVMSMIDRSFVLVADLDGRLIGTIAAMPFIPPWTLERMMISMWFYVRPTFRERDTVSLELLGTVEKLLDERRLPLRLEASAGMAVSFIQSLAGRPGYHAMGLGSYMRMPIDSAPDEVVLDTEEAVA